MDHFCHLHAHSSYSFKDGLAPPDELVARAVELGQPGIGLTDHGVLFGAPALFKAVAEHAGPDKDNPKFRGVIGMEIYEAIPHEINPDHEAAARGDAESYPGSEWARFKTKYQPGKPRYHHLTLWAMNETGWFNLCALHTQSFTEAFKPKNQPLIDRASLERHSDGLILGLGCPASRTNFTLATQGYDAAVEAAEWYFEVFGDRAYVEVMGNLPDQQRALRDQRKLAQHFGRPTLAVNDVHYVERADGVEHGAHHTLVQARKYKSSATADEKSDDKSDDSYGSWYGSDEFFVKSRDEMLQTGMLAPEVDQTIEVLKRVDTEFDFLNLNKPAAPHAAVPAPGENTKFDEWLAAA